MMPPRIAVVRHGRTAWNRERRIQGRSEIPLDATGRGQALRAATSLGESGTWTGVRTSPLGRARETAGIIAEALGLAAPSPDVELIERDYGDAEGLPSGEAESRWPGLDIPGAEPPGSLARRGADALARLLAQDPGVIIVSHGAILRAGLGRLCGVEVPRILNGEVWLLSGGDRLELTRLGPLERRGEPSCTPPHRVARETWPPF